MFRLRITVLSLLILPVAQLAAFAQRAEPFQVSPREAVSLLDNTALADSAVTTKADLEVLADAADGKLDRLSLDEAVLIASGVTEADARRRYCQKLQRIGAAARQELAGAETALERGERLLKFLHRETMAGGYSRKQTEPHTVLDTATFNCVSSAAVFNLIAARLGHQVRAVEIPEHVFSIFYDGSKWVDVETTNRLGFNPAREAAAREKIKKPGGVVYIPERHANLRREIDELGMVAVIYYNRGVALGDAQQFREAATVSFIALGLDPANQSAAKNALAHLNNWVLALNDCGEFEQAIQAVALGLRIAAGNSVLMNNRKVVWQDYAHSETEAGRVDSAIAVLRRAAADVPDSDFTMRQAYLFQQQAQPHLTAGRLAEAIGVVEQGMKKVDPPARQRLEQWRSAQVHNHILRTMRANMAEGQYESALSVVADHARWIDDEITVRGFKLEIYDRWARKLAGENKWQAAAEVYAAALQAMPGDRHLTDNAVVLFDRWARSHMQTKDWQAAIKVYKQGLAQFPSNGLLTNNLNYCKQQS